MKSLKRLLGVLLFYPLKWASMLLLFGSARLALGHYHRTKAPASLFRARRAAERFIAVRFMRRPRLFR